MPRNPFKKRSTTEKARDRADLAVESLREAVESVRDSSDALLADMATPVPAKSRKPLFFGTLAAGAAAIAYKLRSDSSSSDVPSPGNVTPTAPLGPTDPSLNDPALKAKVESELFAADDAPKGKINIDVADGVVTLRGELDSSQEANEIADRARKIGGVRRVENLISSGEKTSS